MSQATPADLASLAEELAEGVGVGHISEATAERLQSALPAVSFLSCDVEADAEGALLAGIGNLMLSGYKNLALLGPEEASHPDRTVADSSDRLTSVRVPVHTLPRSHGPPNPFAEMEQSSGRPIAHLQAYVASPAGSEQVRESEAVLRALASQLQSCLKPHADLVANSAFMFALGRPAPSTPLAPASVAMGEASSSSQPAPMGCPWPRMENQDSCDVALHSSQPPALCTGMDLDSATYLRGGRLRGSISPWELPGGDRASMKPAAEGKTPDSCNGEGSWHPHRRPGFSHSSPTQPSDDSSGGMDDLSSAVPSGGF